MTDIFQFFFTSVINICGFSVFQYMVCISAVICLFGIVTNRL